jgi:Rad3-related DNA helicase
VVCEFADMFDPRARLSLPDDSNGLVCVVENAHNLPKFVGERASICLNRATLMSALINIHELASYTDADERITELAPADPNDPPIFFGSF